MEAFERSHELPFVNRKREIAELFRRNADENITSRQWRIAPEDFYSITCCFEPQGSGAESLGDHYLSQLPAIRSTLERASRRSPFGDSYGVGDGWTPVPQPLTGLSRDDIPFMLEQLEHLCSAPVAVKLTVSADAERTWQTLLDTVKARATFLDDNTVEACMSASSPAFQARELLLGMLREKAVFAMVDLGKECNPELATELRSFFGSLYDEMPSTIGPRQKPMHVYFFGEKNPGRSRSRRLPTFDRFPPKLLSLDPLSAADVGVIRRHIGVSFSDSADAEEINSAADTCLARTTGGIPLHIRRALLLAKVRQVVISNGNDVESTVEGLSKSCMAVEPSSSGKGGLDTQVLFGSVLQ